ncbi:MAG: diguanylate cyclase [Alphaproteobacteria bacterium]
MIALNNTAISIVIKRNPNIFAALTFLWRYWIVALIFGSVVLFMQATLFLGNAANGEYKLSNTVYFVDDGETANFNDILSLSEERWKVTQSLRFKPTNGKVWLRVDVPKHNESSILLRFKNPLLDIVDIKLVGQSEESGKEQTIIAEYQAGDLRPFADRQLALPNLVIPLDVSQQNTTLYISASSKLSIELGFGLWSKKGFLEFNDHLTILFGIVFGYMLALVCYSLMMYATIQKTEYMWYGLYLGGFLLHAMSLSGFGFQYLWPQGVGLQAVMGGVSISLTYLCLVKFTQMIILSASRVHNLTFNTFIYFHLVLSGLSLISLNPVFLKFHMIAVILTLFSMPILCYAISKTGSKVARFFIFVWIVFLITSLIVILGRLDLIALQLEHIYVLFIGFHLETLMIGLALIYGYRVRHLHTLEMKELALHEKEKSVQSKDQILQLQQDAQSKLKGQVKAQTVQLEGALDKLSLASSELELIRNFDGLTGLPNRLAFEESLKGLSKSSINMGDALCVVVIDIDHFKKVNDTFGHMAGDECLRAFSALLKERFHGNDYTYCRFGGEEFIVATILPLQQVKEKLEEFRIAVQALEVSYGGHTISFTISSGVFSKHLINIADSRELLSKADGNLYLAKQKGRNLVVA